MLFKVTEGRLSQRKRARGERVRKRERERESECECAFECVRRPTQRSVQ